MVQHSILHRNSSVFMSLDFNLLPQKWADTLLVNTMCSPLPGYIDVSFLRAVHRSEMNKNGVGWGGWSYKHLWQESELAWKICLPASLTASVEWVSESAQCFQLNSLNSSPIVAARDGGMGWLRRKRGNTHHHSAENVCSSTVACKPMPINPTNNLGKALYCLENDSNLQSRVKKKTNKLQGLLAFMNDPYT